MSIKVDLPISRPLNDEVSDDFVDLAPEVNPTNLDGDAGQDRGKTPEKLSSLLLPEAVYTRETLKEILATTDATINTGIFQPAGSLSILLFITKEKTSDRTQYSDSLEGDILHWQGQMKGRKDSLIINHRKHGTELLVFYREKKYQYAYAGFRYEGPFDYLSHTGSEPSSFVLRRHGALLETVAASLEESSADEFNPLNIEDARTKMLGAIVRRQGQPAFRKELLRAYRRRCAISGCQVVEVLEAAHIIGYRGPQTNHVTNGLLLRGDLHTLFDLGMIAIDPQFHLIVSPFLAGTEYEQWDGRVIAVPKEQADWPNLGALGVHRASTGL